MSVTQSKHKRTRVDVRSLNRPRLGFVGLGWIGLSRMRSIAEADIAEILAVADVNAEATSTAIRMAPDAKAVSSFDELLDLNLDGIVIATPSGMHANQALQALERGVAVFCQKPLARTAAETRRIVEAAETADRLLAVDFSYRYVNGMEKAKELVQSGQLGKIFLVDLVFHNAYGPDKEWFYDLSRSGGGCVMDLGTHLVDLAHWVLGESRAEGLRSRLWRHGEMRLPDSDQVEDAAAVEWVTPRNNAVRLACSWNLHAGREAVIEAHFYGTEGAVALRNLQGSFYDFVVEHHTGTTSAPLADPDSNWGGRAAVHWTEQLAVQNRFDPRIKEITNVARLMDEVYGR